MEDLFEALGAAGISLEKDEEEFVVRDDGSKQHYVLLH
jgi:hypothetical protein